MDQGHEPRVSEALKIYLDEHFESLRSSVVSQAEEVASKEGADTVRLEHLNIALGEKLTIAALVIACGILASCNEGKPMKPDLDAAIQAHFDAINHRDLEAFKAHLTTRKTLYTIVQNGHAFTTPEETIAIHEQWFQDPNWIWEGSVIHKVVGEDVAMALVKYKYRTKPEDQPIETWLTYVFELEDGQWRIVHDHNTSLDFPAFARMAGIEIK